MWRVYGLLSRSGRRGRIAACFPSKGRRVARLQLCRKGPWNLLSGCRVRCRPQTSYNHGRLKKRPRPQAKDVAYSPSQPSSEIEQTAKMVPIRRDCGGMAKKQLLTKKAESSRAKYVSEEQDKVEKAYKRKDASATKWNNANESNEEPTREKQKIAEESRDSEEEDKEVPEAPNEPKTPIGEHHAARTGPKIIYVSNLPHTVRDKNLREFFEESGSIEDISLSPHSNKCCYGVVTFAEVEGAQRALVMDDRPMMGRKIKVKKNFAEVKTLLAAGDTSQ